MAFAHTAAFAYTWAEDILARKMLRKAAISKKVVVFGARLNGITPVWFEAVLRQIPFPDLPVGIQIAAWALATVGSRWRARIAL